MGPSYFFFNRDFWKNIKNQAKDRNKHKSYFETPATRKRCVITKIHKSAYWLQILCSFIKSSQNNFELIFLFFPKITIFSKIYNSVPFKVPVVDWTAKDTLFHPLTHLQKQKNTKHVYFCKTINLFSKIINFFSNLTYLKLLKFTKFFK